MGSEQGFQANKVDPEAEDRTKKAQKNRLKKLLTQPRAEDTDLFVVKTEKEKPEPREEQIPETKAPVTETEEPKDTDALPAQAKSLRIKLMRPNRLKTKLNCYRPRPKKILSCRMLSPCRPRIKSVTRQSVKNNQPSSRGMTGATRQRKLQTTGRNMTEQLTRT